MAIYVEQGLQVRLELWPMPRRTNANFQDGEGVTY